MATANEQDSVSSGQAIALEKLKELRKTFEEWFGRREVGELLISPIRKTACWQGAQHFYTLGLSQGQSADEQRHRDIEADLTDALDWLRGGKPSNAASSIKAALGRR